MIETMRLFSMRRYRFRRPRILARVACLGTDVLSLLGYTRSVANHQKNRIDFIKLQSERALNATDVMEVSQYIKNSAILYTILQQRSKFLTMPQPDAIVVDSFSELTDQMFVHKKKNYAFLAHYSDVDKVKIAGTSFENRGLLSTSVLESEYNQFFASLRQRYGQVPICFLHFPVKFENRPLYIERAEAIADAVGRCALKHNVHSIALPNQDVERSVDPDDALKDFPYHYAPNTYSMFASALESALNPARLGNGTQTWPK